MSNHYVLFFFPLRPSRLAGRSGTTQLCARAVGRGRQVLYAVPGKTHIFAKRSQALLWKSPKNEAGNKASKARNEAVHHFLPPLRSSRPLRLIFRSGLSQAQSSPVKAYQSEFTRIPTSRSRRDRLVLQSNPRKPSAARQAGSHSWQIPANPTKSKVKNSNKPPDRPRGSSQLPK